jgi:kynurenine formamidase
MNSKAIVDLSHRLGPQTPPFPGDGPVMIEVMDAIRGGSNDGRRHCNSSRLNTSMHCGTHMDAPFHFFNDGKTIDTVSLNVCVGPAALVSHPAWTAHAPIEPAHLEPRRAIIKTARRIVMNSGWSRRFGQDGYFTDHPVISGACAQWLVDLGVVLVGVDFPSVDRPPHLAHDVLLGNGLVIVENLTNLDEIGSPVFELCALPLAVVGRDGSPVRAVGRALGGED